MSASASDQDFVEIDGSVLEGGGQILRMASAFSVILGKPIHISKIRAGRGNPGLRPQHLSGLILLRDLCNGDLKQAHVGSTEVWLSPGKLQTKDLLADTGTAGSITLLLQSTLPCLAVCTTPIYMTLRGGTNVDFAPQIEWLQNILLPALDTQCGLRFEVETVRKGFYPKGQGEVRANSVPNQSCGEYLQPISLLDRGDVTQVHGVAWAAGNLNQRAAQTISQSCRRQLHLSVPIHINTIYETSAFGTGSGIWLKAEMTKPGCAIGVDSLGGKNKRHEDVGMTAAQRLNDNLQHGGCVCEWMQDQLIIYAVLAKGRSQLRTGSLTMHTRTAIHVAQLMTEANFTITEEPGCTTTLIEVDGIGVKRM